MRYISDANESIIENFKWDLEKDNIENVDEIVEFLKNNQNKEYAEIEKDIIDFRLDTLEDTTYSIENLPEWLICLFADFLIKLTAIKQKTSSEVESVSIETDILIISKANGLKWINNDNTIV
jgi:hypothetical protein